TPPPPILTDSESMTRTGTSPSTDLAAIWADWMVADSLLERLMHTIPSAPAAAAERKTSSNAPGGGAAVSGRTGDDEHRAQNSLGDKSRRSTNSSFPKRMLSGTMSMPSSVASSAGRSQELSVTTRTPA